jgi:hypothetical protein
MNDQPSLDTTPDREMPTRRLPHQTRARLLLYIRFGAVLTTLFLCWVFAGTSVQVFGPNATTFSGVLRGGSQGVFVCVPPSTLTYMHVVSETRIFDQRRSFIPTAARVTDLRRGQQLQVWQNCWPKVCTMFSSPPQEVVGLIIIENDGQTGALNCDWPRGLNP